MLFFWYIKNASLFVELSYSHIEQLRQCPLVILIEYKNFRSNPFMVNILFLEGLFGSTEEEGEGRDF
jgi:hypothetical protein